MKSNEHIKRHMTGTFKQKAKTNIMLFVHLLPDWTKTSLSREQTHTLTQKSFHVRCVLRASPRTIMLSERDNHSRPQRPRSFWSAPRIATSGLVQRHFVFEWLCKHNRLRPQPIRFVRLDSEHAQSDGKSVNRGLPVLDLARGRDSWC